MNVSVKFEVRSFSRSRDNRGYAKKMDSPWIRPRSIFCKIFNGLLFGLAMQMYSLNLKSVALPVPEIRGGSQVANPQSRGRGDHRGSGMVPFERALALASANVHCP